MGLWSVPDRCHSNGSQKTLPLLCSLDFIKKNLFQTLWSCYIPIVNCSARTKTEPSKRLNTHTHNVFVPYPWTVPFPVQERIPGRVTTVKVCRGKLDNRSTSGEKQFPQYHATKPVRLPSKGLKSCGAVLSVYLGPPSAKLPPNRHDESWCAFFCFCPILTAAYSVFVCRVATRCT